MNKITKIVILVNLVIMVIYFNYSIQDMEELIKDGRLIFLELTPKADRSSFQANQLLLDYRITEGLNADSLPKRGYCVLYLNDQGVGNLIRMQRDLLPLGESEYPVEYTITDGKINIGSGTFTITEGKSDDYNIAKYTGIKIDEKGRSILIGMFDLDLKQINK